MDRSEDPGRWLFIGLCIGALFVMVTWGFQAFAPPDPACEEACQKARDLSAQQSMALAAWGMIIVTFVSAALGAWSLYLIRENLIEARKVSREAERSAKAAEDAILTTREMGMAQVRAYIAVTGVNFVKERMGWRISISMTNSGQTPADTVKAIAELIVVGRVEDNFVHEHFKGSGNTYLANIPAGGSIEADVFVPDADTAGQQAIFDEGGAIRVEGSIDYNTVFKGKRESEPLRFVSTLQKGTIVEIKWTMRRAPVPTSDRFA